MAQAGLDVGAPKLTARYLRDIRMAEASPDYKFLYDAEGEYGEAGTFYFAFTAHEVYDGQRHIIRGRFIGGGGSLVYPQSAPRIYFVTPMFHSNVSTGSGGICLNILNEKWSALNTLDTVFFYVLGLLCEPNPDSPLNSAANIADPAKLAKAADQHYKRHIGGCKKLLDVFWPPAAAPEANTSETSKEADSVADGVVELAIDQKSE